MSGPLCSHLYTILNCFSLSQLVTEPTHIKYDGTLSLLDLVLSSVPDYISSCILIPPLANSDHLGIQLNVTCKPERASRKRRPVWRYKHADFTLASSLLLNFNFAYLFHGRSIDSCWSSWKKAFLSVMDICIPKARKRSLPCMTKHTIQLIRKRNYYFRKYKSTKCIFTYRRYKALRNEVVTTLQQ